MKKKQRVPTIRSQSRPTFNHDHEHIHIWRPYPEATKWHYHGYTTSPTIWHNILWNAQRKILPSPLPMGHLLQKIHRQRHWHMVPE